MARSEHLLDVVVVGGGLAGLGAAAFAARTGARVTLVERATSLGGRAATARHEGFSFNRGPHALYRRGEAMAALKELGVPVPGKNAPARGAALHGGKFYRLPVDTLSLLSTRLLGLAGKATAARLLAELGRLDADALAGTSITDFLGNRTRDPVARALAEAFFRVSSYGNAPDIASAGTAVSQLARATHGVVYVDGGWQTLVDGLAERARSSGAALESSTHVDALVPREGGGHVVVLADGRRLAARSVILALPPREAARLVALRGAAPPPALAAAEPVRMSTLDVALSRLPADAPRFVLGIDRPLYLSLHSDVAALAPSGGAMLHVAKYLPPGESDPKEDRKELETLLDLAQPGWRSVLVDAQYLPRITVAERLDLAADGGAAGRPDIEIPGLPGVLFAGDWVKGGGFLADASVGSAKRAAGAALSHALPRAAPEERAVA